MKLTNTLSLFIAGYALFSKLYAQTPIQAGEAYFQTINKDANGNQNEAFYPRVAAPNKVSATTYAGAPLSAPYRLHSWMGGAMLWATGAVESGGKGYFVDSGATATGTNMQTWPAPVFQQGPVIADPIILSYSQPPNATDSNPLTRGIQATLPYPYLAPDAAWGGTCGTYGLNAPLAVYADPIPMILVYPATSAPPSGVATGDAIWGPTAILVDDMGDYSTVLVYQNPSSPYGGSGVGQYIKATVVQGSPFIFFECCGIQYVAVSNQITASGSFSDPIINAVSSGSVPMVTNIDYALISGIQIDPAQYAENNTTNPMNGTSSMAAGQACYTTWALYYNTTEASFTADSATAAPQNNYLTINNTSSPTYFVLAALPTIFQYPYPGGSTFASAYTTATTNTNYNVQDYAEAVGQYAFNFITDTTVSYTVTNNTTVDTSFTPTLSQPYGAASVASTTDTIMCLMPHHYQPQTFDTNTMLAPTILPTSPNWSAFSPTGATNLFYWDIRGNLMTILGSSFATEYIFSNFLPTMPPPAWLDTVTLGGNTYTGIGTYGTVSIGQLLFDSLDNEYVTNLVNPAYAPWNTGYTQVGKGIYDVGKTLAKDAKQLGLLMQFIEGYENNNSMGTSTPLGLFFGNGTQPPAGDFTVSNYYGAGFTSLLEQQYNNTWNTNPLRPGAFNPLSQATPPTMPQALSAGLQSSVAGSTSQVLAGVQGAITPYFAMTPTACTGGTWMLSHYAYYDTLANLVMLYPSAAAASNAAGTSAPWPGRKGTLPAPNGPGGVFESFGVADAFNDHHYQYGWWITAAALAAIYDGSWSTPPAVNNFAGTGSPWAASSNYGAAIDQLVKDIAYDPAVTDWYSDNSMTMQFAKMNFFDQWAGHGWADGIQASIAGGNGGHNENSIGEALQAYASIILWGMATQRQDIVNLGIYLYATTSYAMDSYFFDKNLNFVQASSGGQMQSGWFVPTVTTTTTIGQTTYTAGTGFWDYTISNTTPGSITSGTPKMAQGIINYSADFGQTPENVKVINAFPCNSFSLVFGRNKTYLQNWNAAMDSAAFCSTISDTLDGCWTTAFVSNINMLRGLGGNQYALGVPGELCASDTPPSPYAGMVNIFTSQTMGDPPWGSTGGAYTDPGQSINEVLHFLHVLDHYGTPDWNYVGYADSGEFAFTAAFTKGGTTTYFAFNPTFTPITVNFYAVGTTTPSVATLTVNPKRWAHSP